MLFSSPLGVGIGLQSSSTQLRYCGILDNLLLLSHLHFFLKLHSWVFRVGHTFLTI